MKSASAEDRDLTFSPSRNSLHVQILDRKSTLFVRQFIEFRESLSPSLSLTITKVLESTSNYEHGVIDLQNCDELSCDESPCD